MKCYVCGAQLKLTYINGIPYCFKCESDGLLESYGLAKPIKKREKIKMNQDIGIIENYLIRKGVRLTPKGRRWADNVEGIGVALFFLLVMAIVGSIESGRWFG